MTRLYTVVVILLFGANLLLASSSDNFDDTNKNESVITKRQASAIPTIENCRKLREECLKSCPKIKNCTELCPVCPILTVVDPVAPGQNVIVNRNFIVQNDNGTAEKFSVSHLSGLNHTTVIRLSNIINNTNIVKVPTVVNSTNINNIKIFANNTNGDNDLGGAFGLGVNDKNEPCCYVIHPKTCRYYLNGGRRCAHKKHKTCGVQCKARNMHVHARNRCKTEGCQRDVAYIPQPEVSCFYTQYWPFVSCPGGRRRSCAGCYEHYGRGYSSYSASRSYSDCAGCYNEGFDYGPLYRRGPVLRPFYYHEPPCYITGLCPYYNGYYQSEFDHYYGNDMIDPIYGPNIYEDDDNMNDNDNTNNSSVSDWGVVLNKCKVVSGNSTVKFENCTLSKDHPYAAAPEVPSLTPPMFADFEIYDQSEYYRKNRVRSKNQRQTRRLKRKIRKSHKSME